MSNTYLLIDKLTKERKKIRNLADECTLEFDRYLDDYCIDYTTEYNEDGFVVGGSVRYTLDKGLTTFEIDITHSRMYITSADKYGEGIDLDFDGEDLSIKPDVRVWLDLKNIEANVEAKLRMEVC